LRICKIKESNTIILGDGFLAQALFREALRSSSADFIVSPLMHNWSNKLNFAVNLQSATSLEQTRNLKNVVFALGPTNIESLEADINYDSDTYVNILSQFIDKYSEVSTILRFIFLSSASVYGESFLAMKENDKLKPLSKYANSLKRAEDFLKSLADKSHHMFVVLRLTSIYDNSLNSRVLGKIRFAASKNVQLQLHGSGGESRDFLHTSDLFKAILQILKIQNRYEIYNIGSGINFTISEVIQICTETNNDFAKMVKFTGDRRIFEPITMRVNIDKLHRLDFVPRILPEYGLRQYFK
jgi:nucleoside-diphosphate-sugar epimerase